MYNPTNQEQKTVEILEGKLKHATRHCHRKTILDLRQNPTKESIKRILLQYR